MGSTVRDPPFAWQIKSIFAEFPKCRYCPLHELPCGRRYYGLYLLHLTLAPDHWLARNVGCLKMLRRLVIDTSPPERKESLAGLVEFNEREYLKLLLDNSSGYKVPRVQQGLQTVNTQWRHKSKKSENLGRCGKQNMLWPYLKVWEWE